MMPLFVEVTIMRGRSVFTFKRWLDKKLTFYLRSLCWKALVILLLLFFVRPIKINKLWNKFEESKVRKYVFIWVGYFLKTNTLIFIICRKFGKFAEVYYNVLCHRNNLSTTVYKCLRRYRHWLRRNNTWIGPRDLDRPANDITPPFSWKFSVRYMCRVWAKHGLTRIYRNITVQLTSVACMWIDLYDCYHNNKFSTPI